MKYLRKWWLVMYIILQYIFCVKCWNEFSDRFPLLQAIDLNQWLRTEGANGMPELDETRSRTGRTRTRERGSSITKQRQCCFAHVPKCRWRKLAKNCFYQDRHRQHDDSFHKWRLRTRMVCWKYEYGSDSIAYSISGQREWSSATVFKCYQTPDFHSEVSLFVTHNALR